MNLRVKQRLNRIVEKLPQKRESEHFRVHYGLRNPSIGKGLGASGVEDISLIEIYIEALEKLYSAMTAPPWSRPSPVTGDDERTNVYVFDISELFSDGSPFVSTDLNDVPFICLTARSFEPSIELEHHRAAAEAVHEATHIFNHRERSLNSSHSGLWDWVDEAIAVYLETHLTPGNYDSFRFLKNWIDLPEIPLDDWSSRYNAGMFVCYLENRMPGFINSVWLSAEKQESPVQTISRLMPAGQKFISSDPGDFDLFAHCYCLDSYFLRDLDSAGLFHRLFERFGERSMTESFILEPGRQERTTDQWIDHLACRYYRFYLKADVRSLEVQVRIEDESEDSMIKALVAAVTADGRCGEVLPLSPLPNSGTLFAELTQVDPGDIDHFVMTVINCGTKLDDDNRRFSIAVQGW